VDTTKINHISLCAGYGGIDLGLKRAIPNLRTIAFSEIESFPIANLVAKMEAGYLDAAPVWTDIKTFPWEEFRDKVDILSGGYPCQPFSAAGKRLGRDDPRHLWPWIADGIVSMRPRICFFENVEGHISLGLREVISELEGLGYQTTWGVFSAREVGAPHQRKRVFILAERSSERGSARFSRQIAWQEGDAGISNNSCHQAWPSRPGQPQHEWEPPRVVGNTKHDGSLGLQECRGSYQDCNWSKEGTLNAIESEGAGRSADCGYLPENQGGQWETQTRRTDTARNDRQAQPSLGGDSDGSADRMDDAELFVTSDNRTDELRLLGNGVVPATATRAFIVLINQLLNQ